MGKGSKKEASHANAGKPSASDSKISSIDISKTPIVENPMSLIQKLTDYIHEEEKNSSALRSETQLLKKRLQESQEEARISKSSAENLEKELQQLRDETKSRIQTTEQLEQELNNERTKNLRRNIHSS